jgi:hypothetical protein
MSRSQSLIRALIVCSLALGLAPAFQQSGALADDLTPIPTVVTPVPTATSEPTVLSEPTLLPTVTREHSPPVTTVVVEPTQAPTQVPTATPVPEVAPTSTPAPIPTIVAPAPAATALPYVPWPSSDQLKQNARLRWGKRVPPSVRRWAFLIVPAAHRYHVDPNLVAAVMTMESNGDPLALSPADARGLMQILHGPWDPKVNVYTGVRMLAQLYAEFGDWTLALAGYNAGPGAVAQYNGVPPIRETRDYVIVVRYLWDLYNRHRLTPVRKTQYRKTLGDLQHFADQRKKVAKLARIADVPALPSATCSPRACGNVPQAVLPLDPFWPAGGSPDPLQQITAYPTSG